MVRLDRVSNDGFPNRAVPGVLYRIGLAISDILWAQIERRGTSIFVVDAVDETEQTYCLVGLQIAPNRDMPVKRYAYAVIIALVLIGRLFKTDLTDWVLQDMGL